MTKATEYELIQAFRQIRAEQKRQAPRTIAACAHEFQRLANDSEVKRAGLDGLCHLVASSAFALDEVKASRHRTRSGYLTKVRRFDDDGRDDLQRILARFKAALR